MAREYLPKLTIAILALSIALILLSTQSTHVAASPATLAPTPQNVHYRSYWYNSTYCNSNYNYDWYYYYGYPYDYCNYYYSYSGYPYYYYYYGYPYYYSSYSYPYYYSNYYSSYPYYYYGSPYSYYSPASYTLTVATDPSNLGTVSGGGSYTQGSSASFSVTQNTVQVSPNTRYVFSRWSGDYSGTGTSGTVTVNGAMKITAVYQPQYYLGVNATQGAPTPQGAGWYNAGDTATLQNAGQTIGGDGGSRLTFKGWSVDGQAPQTSPTLSIVMNGPHNANALYGQQYYLNVQTDQGVASGSGWYDAGSTAPIYVSTPISTAYGVSILFNGWQGDSQSAGQQASVLMDGPKNVIATWRTDPTVLYLTIAAIIIAAVLIVAGIIAFVARGRGSRQTVTQTQTTSPPHTTSTQPNEASQRKSTTETSESTT